MMKLKHTKNLKRAFPVYIQIDHDIYLDLTIEKVSAFPPLYWRLNDPEYNLIEIGVSRDSGMLMSITIPLYNGLLFPLETLNYYDKNRTSFGIPIFDLSLWELALKPGRDPYNIREEFYDVKARCRFEINKDCLHISLFPEPIMYEVMVNDQFSCEFNSSNELIAILIKGISESDVKILQTIIPPSIEATDR